VENQALVLLVTVTLSLTLWIGLHHARLWVGRRAASLHLWIAVFCASSAFYELGRIIQYSAATPEAAIWGVRVTVASVFPLMTALLLVARALAGNYGHLTAIRWFAGLSVPFVAVALGTSLFSGSEAALRTDALGNTWFWADVGPLFPLISLLSPVCLFLGLRIMWRSDQVPPRIMRAAGMAFAVYLILGLHDSIFATGAIQSVMLFDYAVFLLVIVFDMVSLSRLNLMYDRMEGMVANQTAGLAQANAALESALVDAAAAAAVKGEFLARMSHELRTPMNGVLGFADLLDDDRLLADQSEYVTMIKASGRTMLDVVSDVLTFSKLEASALTLEHDRFSIRPLVEEVVCSLAESAHSKGIHLTSIVERDVPPAVTAPTARVRQLLTNLLGNAVKFTDAGGVTLHVARPETGTGRLRFEVRDTGIGIPENALEDVFSPFVQVDGSSTRRHGGTGLGLAIVRQLVQLMGGEVGVLSRLGRGSTFWFEIPVMAAPDTSHLALPRLQGRTALIVADWEPTGRMLQTQLAFGGVRAVLPKSDDASNADFAIIALSDPKQAAELARQLRVPALLAQPLGARLGELPPWAQGSVSVPSRITGLLATIRDLFGEPRRRGTMELPVITHELPDTPLRILLVEDDPMNQKVATHMLTRLGYQPDIAHDGAAAVEAVGSTAYDLVLMDCSMPTMDGWEATRRIRAAEPGADSRRRSRVPIVAMTANAMSGDREKCLDAGMDDYLSKPVRREDLAAMVARWA
jgi:signal transduction histidine kinase/CheY-like chemotaxis protein